MPDARLQRTRSHYACPICEGEGRIDDYEGFYPCSECDGAGTLLRPYVPPAPSKHPMIMQEWVTESMLDMLKRDLLFVRQIQRTGDETI